MIILPDRCRYCCRATRSACRAISGDDVSFGFHPAAVAVVAKAGRSEMVLPYENFAALLDFRGFEKVGFEKPAGSRIRLEAEDPQGGFAIHPASSPPEILSSHRSEMALLFEKGVS